MKRMPLSEMKSLSRNEMKNIMGGETDPGGGSGQCSGPFGCVAYIPCYLNCNGNATQGQCYPAAKNGACYCAAAC